MEVYKSAGEKYIVIGATRVIRAPRSPSNQGGLVTSRVLSLIVRVKVNKNLVSLGLGLIRVSRSPFTVGSPYDRPATALVLYSSASPLLQQ